jgi:hypothetical protein
MAGSPAKIRRPGRSAHLESHAGPRLRQLGRIRLARAETAPCGAEGSAADAGTGVGRSLCCMEGQQRGPAPPAQGDGCEQAAG